MSYSCADFVESMSMLFSESVPAAGDSADEQDALIAQAEHIDREVTRLRQIKRQTIELLEHADALWELLSQE